MELLEIDRIICMKMDLALNNQQRLISHKIQTNKQTNKLVDKMSLIYIYIYISQYS